MHFSNGIKAICLTLLLCTRQVNSTIQLTVSPTGGNSSSELLYGILYEDIYHSGDGGLYAELIRNRAFQGSSSNGVASTVRNLDYWGAISGVSLALDTSSPALSSALPAHMRVDVPGGSTGSVGFLNEGFWGMNVTTATRYAANFYLRGTYSGNIVCAFYSNTTGQLLGSTTFAVSQNASAGWRSYTQTFTPSSSAPDASNTFRLTFDGSKVSGQSLYFNMISVFQQTYQNRNNGMRLDLANTVASMGATYLRMPGGNNMEGNASPYRWKWNETIGSIINRPGRPGTWGDYNTDGFGLLEMMQWCQDMNLETVLGVWAGLYLDGEVVSEAALQPYVTDVLNELEFLTGATSTTYGALRASLGYPTPFKINYIEIGNEDYLNGGTTSYINYRFNMFYNQLYAKYPSATYISTISVSSLTNPPAGIAQDDHLYDSAASFVGMFNKYDNANRNHPIFVAEYAAIYVAGVSGQIENPTLQTATAEAAFLLGLERNSDIVVGSSYGAYIKSLGDSPDNVATIKHSANAVVPSLSYYVQKLFATHHGVKTLPMSSNTAFGPVYWSSTISASGTYYVKIVNFNGAASTPITVTCTGNSKTTATLITLTAASESSSNSLGNMQQIWTETTVSASSAGVFSFTLSGTYISAVLVV